jgi:hypothetical protein
MLKVKFNGSYYRTKQYMNNLVRRGIIPPPMRILWHEDGGRPRNVFCRRSIPYRLLPHEFKALDVADAFRGAGAEVSLDRLPLQCDRYMEIDGTPFHIEIDMGQESLWQLRNLFAKYCGVEGFVLFATVSEKQLQIAKRAAEGADEAILFALINDILKDPFGEIWTDTSGKRNSLPKPTPKTPAP